MKWNESLIEFLSEHPVEWIQMCVSIALKHDKQRKKIIFFSRLAVLVEIRNHTMIRWNEIVLTSEFTFFGLVSDQLIYFDLKWNEIKANGTWNEQQNPSFFFVSTKIKLNFIA